MIRRARWIKPVDAFWSKEYLLPWTSKLNVKSVLLRLTSSVYPWHTIQLDAEAGAAGAAFFFAMVEALRISGCR
jgi:hypothetical protein